MKRKKRKHGRKIEIRELKSGGSLYIIKLELELKLDLNLRLQSFELNQDLILHQMQKNQNPWELMTLTKSNGNKKINVNYT